MDIVQKAKELVEMTQAGQFDEALEGLASERILNVQSAALSVETYRLLERIEPARAARFAARLLRRAEGRQLG